jgi:hypothetical protein
MYESTRFVGIVRREVPRPSEGDRLIVKRDVDPQGSSKTAKRDPIADAIPVRVEVRVDCRLSLHGNVGGRPRLVEASRQQAKTFPPTKVCRLRPGRGRGAGLGRHHRQ